MQDTNAAERAEHEPPGEDEAASSRLRKVYDLRRDGYTYRAIADQLGISVATAHADMKRAVAVLEGGSTDRLVEIATEAARLNEWYARLEAAFDTGELTADPRVEKGVKLAVMLSKERRALLGLDAPRRIAVEGEVDAEEQAHDFEAIRALERAVREHEERTGELEAEMGFAR